jgi:hypothetical protein
MAVYSGDANFLGATSAAVSEQVNDFDLSISTSGSTGGSGSSGGTTTQTIIPGGTANYGFTLTPTGMSTFPSTVTLSVTGLPAGATYTITPTTIAAGSSATAVTLTLTVSLPMQTAAAQHNKPLGKGFVPVALGMLLLPFSYSVRKAAGKLSRMAAMLLLLVASVAGVAGLSGCGSSTGFFAQAPHTYNVEVVATSGTLTHSTTVTLTVR